MLSILWALPLVARKGEAQLALEWNQRQEARQLLFEALDRLVRFEHYFHDIHGRFTRDISRLSFPSRLASGDFEQLRRSYEISVVEVAPKKFLLLATGVTNTDRVTIDESHRMNANFVMPAPPRAYLVEEADRMLSLYNQGHEPKEGNFSRYWQISRSGENNSWVAVGVSKPVLGERREYQGQRALASIFAAVSERVKSKMKIQADGTPADPSSDADSDLFPEASGNALFKEVLSPSDVQEWLDRARLAQHVYSREYGHFARRWEQLDSVSDYHFGERMKVAKNIRVHPIELSADERDFHFTLEGTVGDLMGEQFIMDKSGSMRQVRYTEALIQSLQEGTNLLENALQFQINPIVEDSTRTPAGTK